MKSLYTRQYTTQTQKNIHMQTRSQYLSQKLDTLPGITTIDVGCRVHLNQRQAEIAKNYAGIFTHTYAH